MESGRKNQDSYSPSSIGSSTDQQLHENNSFEGRGSDVLEKPFQSKTFSSQLRKTTTQRRGTEPKTDKKENSKEILGSRNSCIAQSEAEHCSNPESTGKRKSNSRGSPCNRAETSLGDERGITLEKKSGKIPEVGHSSDSEDSWDACPRRAQRRHTERRKRPRSMSPGVQPPPLRKSLVTSLRAMSEAIYQNIVRVQNERVPSSLSWEHLAQLRGRLFTQAQTVYTMATQAAYVFPAEGWLVPATLPGPWGPNGDRGETQSSS